MSSAQIQEAFGRVQDDFSRITVNQHVGLILLTGNLADDRESHTNHRHGHKNIS